MNILLEHSAKHCDVAENLLDVPWAVDCSAGESVFAQPSAFGDACDSVGESAFAQPSAFGNACSSVGESVSAQPSASMNSLNTLLACDKGKN